MSAASPAKIFGIRVGIDPKILVGGLVALAAILFWYNSRSDEGASSAPATTATRPGEATPAVQTPTPAIGSRTPAARRSNTQNTDRSRLRLRPIDATRGDIDPTLRLDLLGRLNAVKFEPAHRSVFEIGAAAPPQTSPLASIKNRPIITPKPPPPSPPTSTAPPPVNIPLKYYGFVKPMERGQVNRGFFMDGDNVLVASEGQVLKQRYLVVELSPNTAKMEDIQMKQGQNLPLTPAALQQ